MVEVLLLLSIASSNLSTCVVILVANWVVELIIARLVL